MVPPQLMLWLLMVGALSVFRISDEAWLGEYLRKHSKRCQVHGWNHMQNSLKLLMWIPLLDELPGKHIYDSLQLGSEPRGNGTK